METRRFRDPSRAHRRLLLAVATALLCPLALSSAVAGARVQAAAAGICPPPPPPAMTPGAGSPPAIAPAIPAPAEVILACVAGTPITGATFDHWATVANKSAEPEHRGKHHSKTPPMPVPETIKEVMGFLISSDWVLDEAAHLGVSVSEATVRRQFDRIRREQFHHRREFRKFLRASGQTIADLLLRVRLNILSSSIQKRVAASAKGAKAKQHALSEFIKGFKARWQPQTVCVAAFTVLDCGSSQEPL